MTHVCHVVKRIRWWTIPPPNLLILVAVSFFLVDSMSLRKPVGLAVLVGQSQMCVIPSSSLNHILSYWISARHHGFSRGSNHKFCNGVFDIGDITIIILIKHQLTILMNHDQSFPSASKYHQSLTLHRSLTIPG